MSVIASNCPEYRVDVVDINEKRIEAWNSEDFSITCFRTRFRRYCKKVWGENLFSQMKLKQAYQKLT